MKIRLALVYVLFSLAVFSASESRSDEASRALRLDIPGLVLGYHDAQIMLYHRAGTFHHGYALVPKRDNLVHRVEVTPSPAIRFVTREGTPIDVPEEMRGTYSYLKKPDFEQWKAKYFDGDIRIDHPLPKNELRCEGDRLRGLLDVLFLEPDASNTAGRNNHSLVYRLRIDARLVGTQYAGDCLAWQYDAKDDTYGAHNPRRSLKITAQWDDQHWLAKNGTALTPGKNWPMAHGPSLTGAAADYDGQLINNLHDARMVWVAEETLPSGRGGVMSRGGFAMFPYAWKTIGYGGYGGPIVADGKVFVYVHAADVDAIMADPKTENDPYVRLGLDPRALGLDRRLIRDMILCVDAQTGATRWRHFGKTGPLGRASKSGLASTPCYYRGKVYVRGKDGLYCLDAETGRRIWLKAGDKQAGGFGIHGAPSEGSVVVVADTLILMTGREDRYTTIGIDPDDGKIKWFLPKVGAEGIGLPGVYETEGRTYITLPREMYRPDRRDNDQSLTPETFVLVDPADGTIVWESKSLGYNSGQILVWKDIAIGNCVRGLLGFPKETKTAELTRVGGVRLSTSGAIPLWKSSESNITFSRMLNVLHRGIFYTDSRTTGFQALDVETGKILGRQPHLYALTHSSHNWNWYLAANDRILTDGIAMFTTGDRGLQLLPGRLSLDITGGYRAPTKPAIADGRLFMRLADKLVCYDLRQAEDYETEVISLTAKGALVGVSPENSADIAIRVRKDRDSLISIGAKAGSTTGEEQEHVLASWHETVPYQRTIPANLSLTDDSLRGDAVIRLGWHHEPWSFDIVRERNRFTGTYVRSAKPLPQPIPTKGAIEGDLVVREDGTRRFMLYLHGSAASGTGMRDGKADANLMILVVCRGDAILHAWAIAGRVNSVVHEVDASRLQIKDADLQGELTILMHDDRYFDLQPELGDAEHRRCSTGSPLAIRTTVNATATGNGHTVTGTHEGLIGVSWSRTGRVVGQLKPDTPKRSRIPTP